MCFLRKLLWGLFLPSQMCLLYGGVPGGQGRLQECHALASAKCQVILKPMQYSMRVVWFIISWLLFWLYGPRLALLLKAIVVMHLEWCLCWGQIQGHWLVVFWVVVYRQCPAENWCIGCHLFPGTGKALTPVKAGRSPSSYFQSVDQYAWYLGVGTWCYWLPIYPTGWKVWFSVHPQ